MGRGEIAQRPMFYVNVPSVLDESMRVSGDDVFSLEVLFTPYRLQGGWVIVVRDNPKIEVPKIC